MLLDNSAGRADAFGAQVALLQIGDQRISPRIVQRVPTGAAVELKCDVDRGRPGGAEYDRSLADAVASALRGLDWTDQNVMARVTDGRITERLSLSYRDHEGNRFSDQFLVRFFYGVEKFEDIELCVVPPRRERLAMWLSELWKKGKN